jgi:uncharacterized membrane protein
MLTTDLSLAAIVSSIMTVIWAIMLICVGFDKFLVCMVLFWSLVAASSGVVLLRKVV